MDRRTPTLTAMTLILTPTHDQLSRTRISVTRPASGGRVVVGMSTEGPDQRPAIRPMLLSSDAGGARVSLIPEGALLLAGDAISIEVSVGPGARLDLIEPGGTVAYAMNGQRASWDVSIDLAPSATLVWAGEPFVVSHGATVDRHTSITVGRGARLALRETIVLGRHHERPGSLRQDLSVMASDGTPVLAESLAVGPDSGRLLIGGSRVISTVLLLGERMLSTHTGTRLELEAEATCVRTLSADAHRGDLTSVWSQARRQLDLR